MQRPGFGQTPGLGASTNGVGSPGSTSFGQGMPAQQSMPSFSFGQPQSGGLFGATTPSQSFPPINGSGTQDNSVTNASFPAFGGNTSFNFGASAPSTGFTFSSGGTSSNPFANLNSNTTSSSTPTFQPSTNLFSANNQAEKPSGFAQSSGTAGGGLFAQPTETSSDIPKNKSTFAPTDDAMHTSPDRSASKTNPGAFSFLNASQPSSASNSLFAKPTSFGSSQNTAEPGGSKAPTFSFGSSATTTPSSPLTNKPAAQNISNIFSPSAHNTGKSSAEAKSETPVQSEKAAGIFGSISRPSLTPAPVGANAQSAPGSQLFSGISQPTKPSFENANNKNTGSTLANVSARSFTGFGSSTPKAADINKDNSMTSKQPQAPASGNSSSLFNFNSATGTPSSTSSGNNVNIFSGIKNATNNGSPSTVTSSPESKDVSPAKNIDSNQMQATRPTQQLSEAPMTSKDAISRLRYLNVGLLGHLAKQDRSADWSSICRFYLDQASQILGPTSAHANNYTSSTRRAASGTTTSDRRDRSASALNLGGVVGETSSGIPEENAMKQKMSNDNAPKDSTSLFGSLKSSETPQNKSKIGGFSFQDSSAPKTSETASIFKSIVEQPNSTMSNSASRPNFGSSGQASAIGNGKKSADASASPAKASANPFSSIKSPGSAFSQPSIDKPEVNGIHKANASTSIQPPKFNIPNSGSSFMGQFGTLAAKESEKEKEKRKLEDFDSDEDDEAEWERKDAEAQKAKKAKIEAETANAKGMKAKFINGEFVFEKSDAQADSSTTSNSISQQNSLEVPKAAETSSLFSRPASPATSAGGGASVFASPKLSGSAAMNNENIFAHLSDVDSAAENKSGKEDDDSVSEADLDDNATPKPFSATKSSFKRMGGDAQNPQDVESDDGESLEDAMRRTPKARISTKPASENIADASSAAKGGLFDRIKMGADGRPERDASSDTKAGGGTDSTPTSNLFSQGSFGKPTSSFGKPSDKSEDHTWKADSPIKFNAGNTPPKFGSNAAPAFSFTPATPASSAGKATASATSAAKPFGTLFGTSSATPSFGSATPSQSLSSSKAPNVGFSFASTKPNGASLGPPASDSVPQSTPTSRATTPGVATDAADSAGDSTAEGDAPAPDPQQRDLTALSETELREEEILFDGVKGKALKYERQSPDAASSWVNKGVGPVRILKGKGNKVVRILMRASPSGKIVINARLLAEVSYTNPQPKTVQVPIMDEGSQMSTWLVRFGADEDAMRFLNACEKNKA